MLILDLDNTIFKTSTMNPKIFEEAINTISRFYESHPKSNSEDIIVELWEKPVDSVFNKYATPPEIRNEFYNKISEIDFNELEIKPFIDYSFLKEINMDRILVTTGLTELQNAKINALGIRNDFKEIHIDDPRANPRRTKFLIFERILIESKKPTDKIWVIGDNPDSEINAAHKLGMKTIQRKSPSKTKSNLSNYYIESFKELHEIIFQAEDKGIEPSSK